MSLADKSVRDCAQITNLEVHPEMLCHSAVTGNIITALPIEINTLHNTLSIDTTECVLCTPVIDQNY